MMNKKEALEFIKKNNFKKDDRGYFNNKNLLRLIECNPPFYVSVYEFTKEIDTRPHSDNKGYPFNRWLTDTNDIEELKRRLKWNIQ